MMAAWSFVDFSGSEMHRRPSTLVFGITGGVYDRFLP